MKTCWHAEHLSTALSTEHQLPWSSALCSDPWSMPEGSLDWPTKSQADQVKREDEWTFHAQEDHSCVQLAHETVLLNTWHLTMHGNTKVRSKSVSHINVFLVLSWRGGQKGSCSYSLVELSWRVWRGRSTKNLSFETCFSNHTEAVMFSEQNIFGNRCSKQEAKRGNLKNVINVGSAFSLTM